MQQHTGQHLVSGVLAELFDYDTLSVHFGAASSTIDLSAAALAPEQITAAEDRANVIVMENRPISIAFVDAAAATGLRKPSTREGALRIVTIDALDRSACGGTHVRATGEIGPILLRKTDRIRGTTRLEFLCGHRAIRQARADYAILARLSGLASASADELVTIFDKQRADLKQAETLRRMLETELAAHHARDLYAAAAADTEGIRRIVVHDDGASLERVRSLAQACAALPKTIFVGVSSAVPGVVAAASDDAGVDVGATLKAALSACEGRGGGSARLAQGTVTDAAQLEGVVRYFVKAGLASSVVWP
jgi:alanyl-tRNA synthetase